MADQEPLDTTSQDDDHLPERIRVHALAKRLGVTSKRILAKLGELGNEVRSPQSSVDRAVAESVRASLTTAPQPVAEPGLFDPGSGAVGAEEPGNPPDTAEPPGEAAAATGTQPEQTPGIAAEAVPAEAASGQLPESATTEAAASGTGLAAAAEQTEPSDEVPPSGPGSGSESAGETGKTVTSAADTTPSVAVTDAAGPAEAAGPAGAGSTDATGAAVPGPTEASATAPGATEDSTASDRGTASASDSGARIADTDVPETTTSVSVSATVTTSGPATPAVQSAAFGAAANLFASPVREEPAAAEPVVFESAVVAAPLFLSPDAAAAENLRRRRKTEHRADPEPVPELEPESESEPERAAESDAETTADEHCDQGDDADDQPRRRRRGRRGRGRGRGEQQSEGDSDSDSDSDDVADSAEPADAEAATTDTAESGSSADESEGGSSRRRRRRRRRKVAGESGEAESASADDPPNTVVHEREPRTKNRARAAVDEVQGITGSTRLEAKRQRRRDGREAGRRRPPILTESEFLARRESVDRVMVVREKEFPGHSPATQVAVLEDKILVEHFVTSTGSASMVGNVYLGKVQNVLPSMEAAFVDIGRGRNGVLYAGEVNWEAAGLGGKERKIEQALKPGTQVLVQVSKDPVGHKGARLTTQISLAGRFLVYVPGGTSTGISRKLPDTERKRLKEILREIVPSDAGVIIRTASEGVSEAELTRDVERLQATWRTITAAAKDESHAPKALYEEPDLLVKVVRDLFNEDFSKLVIEGERAWNTVENYIGTVAPDLLARVSRHENTGVDVFEAHRIDEQLAKALDRKVWLPSGGTLVIDRTEAMTVIDVNTGKFTGSGGGNLEETVTRNNLEAAEEIVRQMRLRDIGGMIVVDFIDMVLESNRDLVLRRLTEALGRDRTRHQVSEVTSLGLVQMTRKKLGTGLVEAFSSTCEHCHGRGILVYSYPVEQSGSEEGSGRGRESGSRRRRNRDKPAAAAPPALPAPATENTEEDAAAKRAHPVALAMAGHTDTVEESIAAAEPAAPAAAGARTTEDPVTDTDTAVGKSDTASAETVGTADGADVPARAPRRRRGRVRRAAGAAASGDHSGAESNGKTAHAGTEADTATASAATNGRADEVAASADTAASPAPAGDAAVPSDAPAAPDRENGPVGESGSVPGAAADTAQPPAVEVSPDVTGPAAGDSGTRTRRRRVARSTSAPTSDPASAVFVLPATEQPSAAPAPDAVVAKEPVAGELAAGELAAGEPVAGELAAGEPVAGEPVAGEPVAGEPAAGEPAAGEPAAEEPAAGEPVAQESAAEEPVAEAEAPVAEVPVRRVRRRAAGRPAGPPVDDEN